jgi:hypothetical protein
MNVITGEAAGPSVAPEYQVKAAFLFQFSRFVQWPPDSFSSAEAPLVICVLGMNPFGSALEEIAAGELVQTHPLSVERHDRVEDVAGCHIVFVSGRDENATRQALEYLSERHVLTVSDGNDFTQRGGIIGLVTVEGKVRVQVNRSSADGAQLRISAKLLRLADQVG